MPTRTKRPRSRRRYGSAKEIEESNRHAFHETAHAQRTCQGCGKTGPYESHHVVEKAELKRQGRMDLEWDTRNCMRLCNRCHRKHTNRSRPIRLTALFPTHFEFAYYLLGHGAYRYLREKYAGEDPRLDRYRDEWEEAHG